MIPNAITVLALCMGLTGVSLAIRGEWDKALGAIVLAGVLDGIDGRIARLLRAQSKFGAELDSLSDNIAFGTAPALILFLWSLQTAPRFGWIAALALAVCCALRLARFNARIDAAEQPHKSARFNTGVPAPAGAGLAFVPIYLWLITGNAGFRHWPGVMVWTIVIAMLMISSIPTYSWASLRIRREWRMSALAGVALLGGSADRRAVGDLARSCCALPGDDPAGRAQLRAGQAAARQCGSARMTRVRVRILTRTGATRSEG